MILCGNFFKQVKNPPQIKRIGKCSTAAANKDPECNQFCRSVRKQQQSTFDTSQGSVPGTDRSGDPAYVFELFRFLSLLKRQFFDLTV